ncbi:hypothetical protein HHI36_005595 [Cryptolaemus montrouzieri]|uniref:Hydrocephalus-inducing protein n=1 Tax=Cryptolaemus montrouzieri TaxID=559131 RepID=A0ABD2NW81_9CUCU
MENIFIVPPYENYELAIKYLPAKVESACVQLYINNPQLGTYTYNLILNAQAPNSEPEIHFKTPLGRSTTRSIFLPRSFPSNDLHAKIADNKYFEVTKINTLTDKPNIEVSFYPSDIGISRGALNVISYMGEYTYPLVGEAIHPEPQGPLTLGCGETITIEFKNPFEDNRIFQFSLENNVENNFFIVKPPFETIKGRNSTKISITAQRPSRQSSTTMTNRMEITGFITAKLSIVCEHENAFFKWIYYLQCKLSNK